MTPWTVACVVTLGAASAFSILVSHVPESPCVHTHAHAHICTHVCQPGHTGVSLRSFHAADVHKHSQESPWVTVGHLVGAYRVPSTISRVPCVNSVHEFFQSCRCYRGRLRRHPCPTRGEWGGRGTCPRSPSSETNPGGPSGAMQPPLPRCVLTPRPAAVCPRPPAPATCTPEGPRAESAVGARRRWCAAAVVRGGGGCAAAVGARRLAAAPKAPAKRLPRGLAVKPQQLGTRWFLSKS